MALKRGFAEQNVGPRVLIRDRSSSPSVAGDPSHHASRRMTARNTKSRRSYKTDPTSAASSEDPPAPWNQDQIASNSRRESSSTMRTSATPLEGAVTYTPTTHRVSKAKKGKRVHACEFPGCGKVFTRAEHRRRHEGNHNPEAPFPCSRAGCRRAFHRPDLLQRHLERHDLEASSPDIMMHRRQMSQVSVSSDAPSTMPTNVIQGPLTPSSAPRQQQSALSIGALVNPSDHSQYATSYDSYDRFGLPATYSFMPGLSSSDDSIYYTPESSMSPSSDHFARPLHRHSISSPPSVIDYHPSMTSPLINSFTSGEWTTGLPVPPTILPSTMLDAESSAYSTSKSDVSMPLPFSDLDGHEWTVIRRELSGLFGVVSTGIFHTVRWQQCMNLYWQFFHPAFPIVHQPTFFTTKPSPLLTGALVAIGSQFDSRPDAKQYSMALLDIATRLLRGREIITSRSRMTDMQTVLLMEILRRFRSRRTEIEVSSRFRTLYTGICETRQWTNTNPLAVFRSLPPNYSEEDLAKAHRFWVDVETKRRIVQGAFIMDTQQAVLFEQPLTVIRHNLPRLSTNEVSQSTLPCDNELWESSPVEKWAERAAQAKDIDLAAATRDVSSASGEGLDPFQSHLILSHLVATDESPEVASDILSSLSSNSPNRATHSTNFSHAALLAAVHTPLRALLIVSGESWLYGRKINDEGEFHSAKQRLRSWVDAGTSSLTALWHATNLLRSIIDLDSTNGTEPGELSTFRDTYLLHEQWAIYIAALICWAYGYQASLTLSIPGTEAVSGSSAASTTSEPASHTSSTSNSSSRSQGQTHPSLIEPFEADIEMREYLRATSVAHPSDLKLLEPGVIGRTHGLLESVRFRKIVAASGQHGGLLNEAERVLYRLVEGRSRLSHF